MPKGSAEPSGVEAFHQFLESELLPSVRRQLALQWSAAWQQRAAAPWSIKMIDIAGGTHSADSASAYRGAMRSLFASELAPPRGK